MQDENGATGGGDGSMDGVEYLTHLDTLDTTPPKQKNLDVAPKRKNSNRYSYPSYKDRVNGIKLG
jgi:hypothetical protein